MLTLLLVNACSCRVGIKTELGSKVAAKVDTLRGLLKDHSQKLSLCWSSPSAIPPLGVVQYPELDPNVDILKPEKWQDLNTRGYHPGPYEKRSLKLMRNSIPCQGFRQEEKNCSHKLGFLQEVSYLNCVCLLVSLCLVAIVLSTQPISNS